MIFLIMYHVNSSSNFECNWPTFFWKALPICYSAISAKSSNKQLWIRPKIAQLHLVKKENKKFFCCFQCTKLQQFLHDCALWKYWMYFHVSSVEEFEIFGLFLTRLWNLWRIDCCETKIFNLPFISAERIEKTEEVIIRKNILDTWTHGQIFYEIF